VSTMRFAVAARAICDEARRAGLEVVPGFRSPPRLPVDRSLRRRPGTTPSVAVRVQGRPMETVVADMVEGVLVANGAAGDAGLRARLLAAVAA
jgi:hypothetical protein